MALQLKKVKPVRLREAGLDEKWLQHQIAQDPALLGLGEQLELISKEHSQPSGGRIDFLMHDSDNEVRYEIEMMLGATDPSHIIRTIEYWDVERQRYPTLDHRAVIVAEEITARFFNVIRLLNRAVPMIAIQLSAFPIGNEIVLHFTRVLDIWEFGETPTGSEEESDVGRGYWEKRAKKEALAIADRLISMIPTTAGPTRMTYTRGYITVGTTGSNFCWFIPQRNVSRCNVYARVLDSEARLEVLEKLNEAGLSAEEHPSVKGIRFKLIESTLEKNQVLLEQIMRDAEAAAREKA